MGRPIKPAYIGKPTDYTDGRKVIVFKDAWIAGASAISTKPVYIIKQTGATRYVVSDGETTGTVYLVDKITEQGQGTIRVVYGTNPDYFFHVSKLLLNRVNTFQDKSLAWSFDGENQITSMTADEYTAALSSGSTPVTPTPTAPGKATISLGSATENSITVTITAPTTGDNTGNTYGIFVGTSASNLTLVKTVSEAGAVVVDSLTANTEYSVRVDTTNGSNLVTSGDVSTLSTLAASDGKTVDTGTGSSNNG